MRAVLCSHLFTICYIKSRTIKFGGAFLFHTVHKWNSLPPQVCLPLFMRGP